MKKKEKSTEANETFYFGKSNYRLMLIGLGCIALGFLMMLGADANTVNGVSDANSWNPDIFSFRRVRLAPTLVLLGFAIQVYAILKRNKQDGV